MAVHSIRLLGDPVLRQKAKRVPSIDASTHRLIEEMIESMREANGVGLAAPQIGVSLRVIVISLPDEEPLVLINPEIVKRSGERKVDEGCLSIPGYRTENLTRSVAVIVKGLDTSGKKVRIKAKDDILAEALEHEIDHLNGVLYIDRLDSKSDLIKIEPPSPEEEPAQPSPGGAASGSD